MSFAKATLSGILTSEPEKRFTPNNHAVTSFNISVENPAIGTKAVASEPFLVKVTCWRNLAEAVTVLQKGDSILVDGKLIMNSFQTPEGVQKKLFELEANSIDRLPGKPEPIVATASEGQGSGGYEASSRNTQPAYNGGQPAPQTSVAGASSSGHFSSEDLLTEDDIPF
ncbi:single-stranded DNA-binding protein [Vampirovibrio sp.]|uniref:single-stranded DNA-binding protein n=1 Tax=Vampirovibrio sp. TaxID=2717857 RepID=UPI003594707A